jgi:alpha-1,2-mannosyltransferase
MTVLVATPPREQDPAVELPARRRRRGLTVLLVVVGLAALAVSVAVWVTTVRNHQADLWALDDLDVYRLGGIAARHQGGEVYAIGFGRFDLPFIYPPFAAALFRLLDPVSMSTLKQLVTGASLVGLVVSVWVAFGMAGWRRDATRAGLTALVVAASLWLEPVQETLQFGQINLALLALVLLDVSRPDHRRGKGVLVGLAAGVKLTPAIFLVYWALTRRWRATAVGAATAAGTVAAGWLLLPSASRAYWVDGAWTVTDTIKRGYMGNQSMRGAIERALDGGSAAGPLWLLAAVAVGIGGLWLAMRVGRSGHELAGVLLTALTGLLVSPISWTHHWVWAVPALVLLVTWALRAESIAARGAAGAGALVGLLGLLAWPARIDGTGRFDAARPSLPTGLIWRVPHRIPNEYHWTFTESLAGNSYVLGGAALLAAVAVFWLRPTRGR